MKGYMRSGRVFLDIMAMVSLAGDTLVWVHLFPSGFPTATVVDFRDDATGFTGRSDRLLDILKFARLFRIVQWPGIVTTKSTARHSPHLFHGSLRQMSKQEGLTVQVN